MTAHQDSLPLHSSDSPLWGVVVDRAHGQMSEAQMEQLGTLGVGYAKFWFGWNETEPELAAYNARTTEFGAWSDDHPTDLTRDLLANNPGWVDEYAFPERDGSRFRDLVDWGSLDAQIDQLVEAGIAPMPLIADPPMAPLISVADEPATIAPEPLGFIGQARIGAVKRYAGIGREAYLAHVQLYTASAARRYSDDAGRVVWWNVENEVNFTPVHVKYMKWRTGDAWLDPDFHVELLATLSRGLKLGSPHARATHNVQIWDPNWAEALARYAPHLDALGIGAYPNYRSAQPVQTPELTTAVKTAVALGEELGKPVFVLETGYPSAPTGGGWNEELQAEYLATAPGAAIDAGAAGYIHFTLNDREWKVPEGELQQVEPYWGLVRVDGTQKPSFKVFQDVIESR